MRTAVNYKPETDLNSNSTFSHCPKPLDGVFSHAKAKGTSYSDDSMLGLHRQSSSIKTATGAPTVQLASRVAIEWIAFGERIV
jgi:hypothetical protein